MKQHPVLAHLLSRRSVNAAKLIAPAPSADELKQIFTAAMRVPDHGKLASWKIKVLNKEAQQALGEIFAARFAALNPEATDAQIAFEQQRPQRAPLLIAVLSTPQEGRIPVWEQALSAGALCMNLLHAVHALGYAGCWLTEWPTYDAEVLQAFGGQSADKIAGFIYIGTASEEPEERERPDAEKVVEWWRA